MTTEPILPHSLGGGNAATVPFHGAALRGTEGRQQPGLAGDCQGDRLQADDRLIGISRGAQQCGGADEVLGGVAGGLEDG